MARYTMELREIIESENVTLFDFQYPFYEESERLNFEKLFGDYFYFEEIGFETIARFKHELKTMLHLKMPYYSQLYISELKSKDLNFMLNKDLKETFIKSSTMEVNGQVVEIGNSSGEIKNEGLNTFSDTPQNKIENLDKFISSGGKEKSNTLSNSENNNTRENTDKNKLEEKTELLSQGNIGTTSTGDLLISWRESMINLNEIILQDLSILFMGIRGEIC